jgi:glycosyltransferase involved in cell wall biosynthesis
MVLVSAVITSHKRKPEIVERAIKSVLAQTHKNIELFVVDDSPFDYEYRNDVKQMVEKYTEQGVTYIPHETCSGACVARNTGLAVAKGEFIGFLDDDDEWCEKKVERLLTGFNQDDVGLVYCDYIMKKDNTGECNIKKNRVHTGYVFDELILGNFVGSTSFPLLRTSVLREVGGFDPEQPAVQDLDVWLRIAKRYKINFVDEPLNVYHWHEGDQITKSIDKRIRGLERIIEKHEEYLLTHKKAYGARTLHFISDYLTVGNYKKAISFWIKAVFIYPFNVKMIISYFVILTKTIIRKFILR